MLKFIILSSLVVLAACGQGTLYPTSGTPGSGTVTNFSTNVVSPSDAWFHAVTTNPTSSPNIAFTLDLIPNVALANSNVMVNGVTCTLGTSCSIPSGTFYQLFLADGTSVAQRAKFNLAAGANITITPTDNGTDQTTFTIASTGGGGGSGAALGNGLGTSVFGTTTVSINTTMSVRAVSTTSDTILATDCGGLVTYNNASAIAVALPQPASSGNFLSGCPIMIRNYGAGTVTITPASSTIGGASTQAVTTGHFCQAISDATNWQLGASN